MEIKYLLDTNIVSEPLYRNPNQKILEKLKQHQNKMGIASVVWHELMYGMEHLKLSKKREKIKNYLDHIVKPTLPILPYDEAAGAWHANQRAKLEKNGKTSAFVDGQIAAIAKTNGLVLVTRNVQDFIHFEHLAVENWFVEGI